MLNYDVVIIGGGIAGYTAGMRCLEKGLKTAIISKGKSAFHFSSGSFDVLSHSPVNNELIEKPFEAIVKLEQQMPAHPYSKVGADNVKNAMTWFTGMLNEAGIPVSHNQDDSNHLRITPMGTFKPSWLSQDTVFRSDFRLNNLSKFKRIVMVSLNGFRDFQPQIAQSNITRHLKLENMPVVTADIVIPNPESNKPTRDLRSIDTGRLLADSSLFEHFVAQLKQVATSEDLLVMPAIFGGNEGLTLLKRLVEVTELNFHEVPTMPPSLLGLRVEDTLLRRFMKKGGISHRNDTVESGEFVQQDGEKLLTGVYTRNMGDIPIRAKQFIFASGSFFSQGLQAEQNKIVEPVFNLDVEHNQERTQWHQFDFFSKEPHQFLSFGVASDEQFRPSIQGNKISNLFCAGSILSGYNPVSHGCGSGVSISTAHYIVNNFIAQSTSAHGQTLKEA